MYVYIFFNLFIGIVIMNYCNIKYYIVIVAAAVGAVRAEQLYERPAVDRQAVARGGGVDVHLL